MECWNRVGLRRPLVGYLGVCRKGELFSVLVSSTFAGDELAA